MCVCVCVCMGGGGGGGRRGDVCVLGWVYICGSIIESVDSISRDGPDVTYI